MDDELISEVPAPQYDTHARSPEDEVRWLADHYAVRRRPTIDSLPTRFFAVEQEQQDDR